MKTEIRVAPRNSLILIMDQAIGRIPDSMNEALVAATPSCIAVGTLCEQDGKTHISLSDDASSLASGLSSVFDGMLDTPTRTLSVCTVLDQALLTLDVVAERTRVQVWTNRDSEPDEIHVVVS
jgi:hypothetical protein